MAKSLKRSNAAHTRLEQVNQKRYNKKYEEKFQQRKLYHGLVKNLQTRQNKVFNQDEKKKAWNRMISDMY